MGDGRPTPPFESVTVRDLIYNVNYCSRPTKLRYSVTDVIASFRVSFP